MAYLYINPKGYPVTANSYSGGAMFSECPTKYKYNRRLGYREKNINAAMEFGVAWEAALAFFHTSGFDLELAIDEWKRLWVLNQLKELKYKESESWEEMYHQGLELLKLYAIRWPALPIGREVRFQLNYRKELFPDTDYAGLEDQSFIDMQIDDADPEHTLLPPATLPSPDGKRQLIIDIKTSGKRYPQDARLLRLDPQLRRYSWHTGIETVAFLVGVRNHRKLDRGDSVSLLDARHGWLAGDQLVVFRVEDEIVNLIVGAEYEQYLLDQKGVRGKALEALKEKYLVDKTSPVHRSEVTNQELQFLATTISQETREDTGTVAGHEALAIYEAGQTEFYPQRPGIRFPNNHCTFCAYLGLCIGDETLVQNKLVNISNLAPEPDWLDRMLEDA